MGYLQALQLMVRAYKAARGVMPKGLDLLKLQQRARKKVKIDYCRPGHGANMCVFLMTTPYQVNDG